MYPFLFGAAFTFLLTGIGHIEFISLEFLLIFLPVSIIAVLWKHYG